MNKIIVSFSVVFLVLCIACSEEKDSDLTGNWASQGFFSDEKFFTLTITDSTITENEFGLNRMDYLITRDHNGFEIIDAYHYNPTGFTLEKSNDKLIMSYSPDSSETTFSKIDFKENYSKLLFSDSDLKIELPEIKGADGISIEPKGGWSPLYVGLPKNAKQEFSGITVSGYQIQFFYNRTLQVKDIPNFLKFEKTKLDEPDRDKLKIILFADKGTPQPLLQDIISIIKKEDPGIKIYSAYLDLNETQLQYLEIGDVPSFK